MCLALLDLSDRLVISVFGQDFLDAFYRVQEFADGIVVIQGVDDQGDVFAHIAVDIVRFTQQFRGLVDQVGGQDVVEGPFFVGLIELCHAVGEQTKGGTHEDFVGSPVFEELSYLEHAVTGGDHARTNLSLQVVENVKNNLNQTIYKTIIPRNVRLAEAPSHGLPINYYDARSTGAESYQLLAEEVIHRGDEE